MTLSELAEQKRAELLPLIEETFENRERLHVACDAWAMYRKAMDELETETFTVESERGTKSNPASAVALQGMSQYRMAVAKMTWKSSTEETGVSTRPADID